MFPLRDNSKSYPITTETFHKEQYHLLDYTIDTSTVGGKVQYYRLSANLKQSDLSLKSGVDRHTILRLENNLVQPSLYVLFKIANALSIDSSLLMDDYLLFLTDYDNTIRSLRSTLSMTQKQLAANLNVHRKTVGKWENKIAAPTKENYNAILTLKSTTW